jgi:DNA-binding NarL/FixJ family response regulator
MSDGLTKREQAVLHWLRKGFSNKDIAQAIGISPRTVQKHLQRVYQHLGVCTRAEAIVRTQTRMKKLRSRSE